MCPARPASILPPTSTANLICLTRSSQTTISKRTPWHAPFIGACHIFRKNADFAFFLCEWSKVPCEKLRDGSFYESVVSFTLSKLSNTTTDRGETIYFFTFSSLSSSSCNAVSKSTFHTFVLFMTGKKNTWASQ